MRIPKPKAGWCEVRVHRGDLLVQIESGPNLIVDAIGVVLAQALVGAVMLDTVGVGTNGAVPDPADTALTEAYTRAIDSHSFPEPGKITFEWTIHESEANGKTLREIGLLAGATLCARKVFTTPVDKEDDVKVTGSWTLYW